MTRVTSGGDPEDEGVASACSRTTAEFPPPLTRTLKWVHILAQVLCGNHTHWLFRAQLSSSAHTLPWRQKLVQGRAAGGSIQTLRHGDLLPPKTDLWEDVHPLPLVAWQQRYQGSDALHRHSFEKHTEDRQKGASDGALILALSFWVSHDPQPWSCGSEPIGLGF